MSYWLDLIDFVFSLFSGTETNNSPGNWLRNLESKDGHEPGSKRGETPASFNSTASQPGSGVLPIKVIK